MNNIISFDVNEQLKIMVLTTHKVKESLPALLLWHPVNNTWLDNLSRIPSNCGFLLHLAKKFCITLCLVGKRAWLLPNIFKDPLVHGNRILWILDREELTLFHSSQFTYDRVDPEATHYHAPRGLLDRKWRFNSHPLTNKIFRQTFVCLPIKNFAL